MKTITINSYEELENIGVDILEKESKIKDNFKNYKYYILETGGYYGVCLFVAYDNRIIYIDEQLHYNNTTTDQATQKMLIKMSKKIFNFDEFDIVEDYNDYNNKIDFLNNYYSKMYNSVSIYKTDNATIYEHKIIKNGFLATRIAFRYFEKEEDLDRLYELYDKTEKAIIECLKDKTKREQAILYELENYECFYTWDTSRVLFLTAYGIKKEEIAQVFNDHLKEHEDLY